MSNDSNAIFHWPVRVYYEDTDAGGVVYYANYLRFMERGRTEWLRALGYEQDALRRQGTIFAVRRVTIDYLAPARFDELLTVRSRLTGLGGASLTFAQETVRVADGTRCTQGTAKLACLDAKTQRPCRLPVALATTLATGFDRDAPISVE